MKKFVVYTVVTGCYEQVLQPKVVDDRFDYILFTNDTKSQEGVWAVRPIPDMTPGDAKRLSRYPKTHPETMLAEYAASLYIDANIQIQDQWVYDRFAELYDNNVEYAGVKLVLTGRDSIYDHAYDMSQWMIEYESKAIRQCHALYKLGFPDHYGLNENNIIFRIHTDKMRKTDEEWWSWIAHYSWRDQLSYMFCLWKNVVELNYFLPEGEDARNGQHFSLVNHDQRKANLVRHSFLRKLRVKNNIMDQEEGLKRWKQSIKSPCPVASLYLSDLWSILLKTPALLRLMLQRRK